MSLTRGRVAVAALISDISTCLWMFLGALWYLCFLLSSKDPQKNINIPTICFLSKFLTQALKERHPTQNVSKKHIFLLYLLNSKLFYKFFLCILCTLILYFIIITKWISSLILCHINYGNKKNLNDASPTFTFRECSLGQEGLMLSDCFQLSLGVSILNRNIRPLVGRQWWPNHCSSPPPGFHLGSSFLFLSQ